MNEGLWSTERIAGAALTVSTLILVAAFALLVARRALPAVFALLEGSLEEVAQHVSTFRSVNLMYGAGWILQLLGFGMLTIRLREIGDGTISSLALILLGFAAMLGALEATFHMSVTTWAAQEAARTSNVPSFYEPLRHWVNVSIQQIYTVLGLLALAGYGWALIQTELVPLWVGWASMGWGLVWIVALLMTRGTIPAVLFIMPP
ncbi:MAG: hypothetical protein ACE5M4_12010, partial [Anaerolineales bacterium]